MVKVASVSRRCRLRQCRRTVYDRKQCMPLIGGTRANAVFWHGKGLMVVVLAGQYHCMLLLLLLRGQLLQLDVLLEHCLLLLLLLLVVMRLGRLPEVGRGR